MIPLSHGDPKMAMVLPAQFAPGHEGTTVLMANEVGSPLYDHTRLVGTEGDFGKHIRLIAGETNLRVCGQQRSGSDDTEYDADRARNARKPEDIAYAARIALRTVLEHIPDTTRIVAYGHSAGAEHIIRIVKAAGQHKMIGHEAISDLVVMDYPRSRFSLPGGLLRYALYRRRERRLPSTPKLPEEQLPATPGSGRRLVMDAAYNMRRWVKGAHRDLEWIAKNMPQVTIHAFPAAHSPNTIARWPGELQRYVQRVNRLRQHMPESKPCRAEIYDGPHADGSRARVAAALLRRAGVIA